MSDEQVQTHEEVVDAFYPNEDAEPLEPTEESLESESPEEETEESEVDEEVEESEGEEGSDEETEEVEDVQSIEIDGTEHNLTDIQEWKEAHDNVKLMQADCTKKWQEASDLKKSAETEATRNAELTLELEALLAEEDEESLEELKEYDELEYLKRKSILDKRKAKVEELKANQPKPQISLTEDELKSEKADFLKFDPEWVKDGEYTDKFNADMKVAGEYLSKEGYSKAEIDSIQYSHFWKTIIKASKFEAQSKKVSTLKKRVKKTPKVTKPSAKSSTESLEDIFYGKN